MLSLPFNCNDDLFEAVAGSINNDAWVRSADGDWAGSHRDQILTDSWHSFCHLIKHRTRFHFHQSNDDNAMGPYDISPADMLRTLGDVILQMGLIRTLASGTSLFRGRLRGAGATWQPNEANLGAPPADRASAGRMNPAGIAYLYTSLDSRTATEETGPAASDEIWGATYETSRPLKIVDFTSLPPPPSIFDLNRATLRENVIFLSEFVKEISIPVKKDGREHIHYVPTQVVSEYLAQAFAPNGLPQAINGVLWRSAVRPSGLNLVLFPEQNCWQRKFEAARFVSCARWA